MGEELPTATAAVFAESQIPFKIFMGAGGLDPSEVEALPIESRQQLVESAAESLEARLALSKTSDHAIESAARLTMIRQLAVESSLKLTEFNIGLVAFKEKSVLTIG